MDLEYLPCANLGILTLSCLPLTTELDILLSFNGGLSQSTGYRRRAGGGDSTTFYRHPGDVPTILCR